MGVNIKEIDYGRFGRCVEISNYEIEAIITVDFGPRVIRFGFKNGENEFCDNSPLNVPVGDDTFKLVGGHRLWHSPELMPRTYSPDNEKVKWLPIENGIKLIQQMEPWVQVGKEMEITLDPEENRVKILHRITNNNAWTIELAAWGISIMAPGGMQIIPQPDRKTELVANRLLALWPYTKMNDTRVYWGEKYIILYQNPGMIEPFKIGLPNEHGWAAYFNHGNLFIKKFKHETDEKYPDFGSSYETYTTNYMMEMESLSPLKILNPSEYIEHIEEWELYDGVEAPGQDEVEIEKVLKKYMGR